ncbi:MAG: IS200/IS605 family transposase [Bacteroidetes bacterium]|nr:IS200/IS605 family transposase [Bacteroidota bacterium]
MSHSLVKIWVHAILGVKYRENLINPKSEKLIYKILSREVSKTGCKLFAIGGTENHVHILIMLKSTVSISNVMKQVKGASSRMISRLKLCPQEFYWQIGYGAFSVSEKNVKGVIRYIKNQKIHHQQVSLHDELKSIRAGQHSHSKTIN